jgi:pSer/pThr/pTyr-binding forkhead associated (FHA) protein
MDDTIISDSNLGKRLDKLRKSEVMYLYHGSTRIPILDQLTIGRAKDNVIVVDDGLASRYHALVHKIKEAYFIKDLDSTNGVYVNGKKIPEDKYLKLSQGDIIKIGRTELTFRCPGT